MAIETILPIGSRRREVVRRLALKPTDPVAPQWHRWGRRHANVFFVQIGSHDGSSGDPLQPLIDRHPGWRGIMVEPIPETFARLRERRSDPRFRLVQAAVTDTDGSVMMNLFDIDGLDNTKLPTIEPRVASFWAEAYPEVRSSAIEVPALSFATLTQDVDDIDVLHIDTEGHDGKILAQVDFDAWTLSAVLFEHRHLEADERAFTDECLRDHGFRLWSNFWDTLGIR
jgi:FkbM family methyltransferase